MRLLANLNAGAMLALCLWLAWAALDYNARRDTGAGVIRWHGCECALGEVTGWVGHPDTAAHG